MIGSQPSPRAIVRFAQTYKGIYLLAILVNFTLMARDQVAQWPLNQYLINGAVFLINLLSWWLFRRGNSFGYMIERALSVGRMAMSCAVASVILTFAFGYSPISEAVWSYGFSFMGHLSNEHRIPFFWAFCFSLLGLEILYFRSLREMHQRAKTPQIDEPV